MKPITQPLRSTISLGGAILLLTSLSFAGSAWAYYPPDGTKPDGVGLYQNPGDGICVVGIKLDGTMLVDWSIKYSRDCVAWTKSANNSVNLAGMTTSDMCTKAGFAGNDGYKHAWSTSLCYDVANSRGISRVDLDNTDSMCFSKGGTVVTTGKCVAYGWVYLNRKDDGTLPVSGTGVSMTDGVQSTDGLGFCATSMRMTSATFTSATTCPSKHNSRANADPVGGPYTEWPTCLSSTTGCQTQASYDAGLGWSFTSPNCLYAYGVTGIINTAATKADGTPSAAGTTQDLTLHTNQGDCLANGFSWDNWLPVSGTTTKDSTSGGEYAGMPAGAVIRRLDALTNVEDGGGEFYSGTGAVCQKCHSDQSRSYIERYKPGFPLTRHKLAGDALGEPFQPYFSEAGSAWGLQGVQCAMCHSTAKPAQDDLIQVVPAGVVGPPAAGAPKSASGHNQTEYGTHLLDICYTCHGTPATPITVNPASVIPVSAGDFALTAKGLPPIANQFLNSPHAKYTGSSTKVDVGDKSRYGSTFEGYVCRTAAGKLSSTTYPDAATCTGAGLGYAWYTTASNGNFCYHTATSCAALSTGQWATTFVAAAYRWAADAGGPGGVCTGVGIGSIITTVYRNGVAEKIHNLDSTTNTGCTNPGDGSATSGAAGFWLKDGETSPGGTPADTAQGNCMTCHDVHWALADTNPEAEPLRRECTRCHSQASGESSASGASQINLATINHQAGVGTPLEHMANDPSSACVRCHMPESATGNSPMHLWRISTDVNYVTMGATQVNAAPDGAYTNAGWVDLDHACGQCHGGGTTQDSAHQPVPPALYRTRAALAAVASGMHASSGMNYAVTFSTAINGLTVNVDATVDCGVDSQGVPVTCPTFTYDWNWHDGTGHGVLDPDSHTYATAGKHDITLVVMLGGLQVGAPVTRGVTLAAPDLPPVAGGTCSWISDTWTMQLVDGSTDAPNPPPHVVVTWGDGTSSSVVAGGTISKVYTRIGSFPVTQTATDNNGQSNTRTCGTATPAYFTIGGTVRTSGGTVIPSALVTLRKRAANGTYVTIASMLTSLAGTYSFGSIKPASYSITVTKTGFVFDTAPPFSVGPNATVNLGASAPGPGLSPQIGGIDGAN